MADLASLVQAFTGQASQPSSPDLPWQNQLMQQVDPETARRRNIANALQKASAALATTPGNFLTGLSAAATTGAGEYLQGRDTNDLKRIEAMRAIEQANQTQRDHDLSRLKDAIGIQTQADNTQYARGRDAVGDSRWTQEQERLKANDAATQEYRNNQLKSLTQYRTDRMAIEKQKTQFKTVAKGNIEAERRLRLNAVYDNLQEFQKSLGTAWTEEDQIAQKNMVEQKRIELESAYGIDTKTGQLTDQPPPQVQNPASTATPGMPGKTDKGGAVTKPAPDMALQQARDAIARGADPEAVRQRLIQNGYDASGL